MLLASAPFLFPLPPRAGEAPFLFPRARGKEGGASKLAANQNAAEPLRPPLHPVMLSASEASERLH